MENRYTIQQVMFGMKEEYKSIAKDLKMLREYTQFIPKGRCKDIKYVLGDDIMFEYIDNPTILMKLDELIKGTIFLPRNEFLLDNEGKYQFNSKYKMKIKEEYEQEYDLLVKKILQSNFFNILLKYKYAQFEEKTNEYKIHITFYNNNMCYYFYFYDKNGNPTRDGGMDYDPLENTILLSPSIKSKLKFMLEETTINKNLFDEYCQSCINLANIENKNVILDNNNATSYRIIEEEKKLILKGDSPYNKRR